MRTTFASVARESENAIEAAGKRLAHFQKQVASGKRISSPSDDPDAAMRAVSARGEQATLERYSQAAVTTSARLTVIDSTLSGIVESLSRAQVAAAGATGTAVSAAQRQAAVRDLTGLRDALFDDLNLSYQGTRIFAGSATTTAPFTETAGVVDSYAGNSTEVTVETDRGRSIAVTFDGSRISQGSDPTDVFAVLDSTITAAAAGDHAGLTDGIAALKRAFDRATSLQGEVGNALRAIESDEHRLRVQQESAAAQISLLEDADMTKVISGMTQADTSYRAALAASSSALRVSLLDYLR
jgi:flagellar hook-associated protein 3 FlgL